jgi:hypothetical protein
MLNKRWKRGRKGKDKCFLDVNKKYSPKYYHHSLKHKYKINRDFEENSKV